MPVFDTRTVQERLRDRDLPAGDFVVQGVYQYPDYSVLSDDKSANSVSVPDTIAQQRLELLERQLIAMLSRAGLGPSAYTLQSEMQRNVQRSMDIVNDAGETERRRVPLAYCNIRVTIKPWRRWLWQRWPYSPKKRPAQDIA